MEDRQPKRLQVKDASELSDEKIPRNLILMYGDQPYVMKAGLEWKATKVFGLGGYTLVLNPYHVDYKEKQFVFEARLTVVKTGAAYVNYGEANPQNANSQMQKQLFHLAATRAECRVLRMATACGYASYDEVATQPGVSKLGLEPPLKKERTTAPTQDLLDPAKVREEIKNEKRT